MQKTNCIFCQIVGGKLQANIVYETENIIAFKDIRPKAPVHVLIIPKKHIPTLNEITSDDRELIGNLFLAAQKIAADFGLSKTGYRTVFNCNRDAGQEVFHIHLHLLGGRKLGWPPG